MRLLLSVAATLVTLVALIAPALAQATPTPDPKPPAEAKVKQPKPGFLGVSMEAKVVEGSQPPRALVRVTAVVPGSAAARGGLQIGDLLLELDGASLEKPTAEVLGHFGQLVRAKGAGGKLALLIRRRTVSVQTFLDEKAQGEAKDGPAGSPRLLPDLAKLLEEHPERLVGVRARASDQERKIEVVLGARPGTLDRPLPPNASLRPQLDAAALVPSAQLAQRAIAVGQGAKVPVRETFAELLQRFEKDEGIDDPFRLKTVRYLHRAPLKLANATRDLGRALRSVQSGPGRGPSTAALVRIARRHLDAPSAKPAKGDPPLPKRPKPGSTAGSHGQYVLACLRLAEQRVALALKGLTAKEQKALTASLPTLAKQFAEDIYLHVDADRERWGRHAEAIRLLPKVDRGALLYALEALLPTVSPAYIAQLTTDLKAAEAAGQRGPGAAATRGTILWHHGKDVVIGGSGDNEYRYDFPVVIDLGGDDRYHVPVAGGRPDRPAAIVIDLGGDDRYQTAKPFAQGTGFLGVGLLYDHAGNDHYTSNQSFAQGTALAGAGLLVDRAGDDVYRGVRYTQGSALCQGLGAVLDGGGNDHFTGGIFAQGFAGPGGFGALCSRGGDDRYVALGLYRSGYADGIGAYRGMSQGSSVGFRHQASGGIGVLLDEGGKDSYEAGNFSQGGGYFFGWGLLIDLGVDPDRYEGSRYAQGFAAHSALGSLWDEGGNDVYRGWVGACNGAAWDLSVTVFLEDGGDDSYAPGPGFSLGASAHNGFSLFVDRDGKDRYRIAPGKAGPNTYHGGPSISVFVDAGGQTDRYEGGGLADGRGTITGDTGVLLDLPGPLGDVDEALLKRLLPTTK